MSAGRDVIVVLGAALAPDGRPSGALRRRVELGVRLYHEGLAPRLIMTGGDTGAPLTEAEAMRLLALELGTPDESIVLEPKARNTFENAVHSGRIMMERNWPRALVVTDAYHLPRALYVFRRLGMDATGQGTERTPEDPLWRWRAMWLREGAAAIRSAFLFALGTHKPVLRSVWGAES